MRYRLEIITATGISLILYVALCMYIFRFVVDDTYIGFLYARNLVDHGKLTPSLSNHVCAYTNFLFVMISAGLYWLAGAGILEEVVKFFLVGCGAGTLVVLALMLYKTGMPVNVVFLSLLFLATNTPFVVWTIGGLETVFLSLLFVIGGYFYLFASDRPWMFLVVMLLSVLTRWDAGVFLAPLLLGLFLFPRPNLTGLVKQFCLCFVVPFLVYVGWLSWYYGAVLPTSFNAKGAKSAHILIFRVVSTGVSYFGDFVRINFHWLAMAGLLVFLVSCVRLRRSREEPNAPAAQMRLLGDHRLVWMAAGLMLFFAYLIATGNVHMSFTFRYYVPVIPILALFLAVGWRTLEFLSDGKWRVTAWALAMVLTACNLATFHNAVYNDMLFTENPFADYREQTNTNVKGWILLGRTWKEAAEYFGSIIEPSAGVRCMYIGIFPYFLKADVYDEYLIGASPDSRYDYHISHCNCVKKPPPGIRRWGRSRPAALYYPYDSCFCLFGSELTTVFDRWNWVSPWRGLPKFVVRGDLLGIRRVLSEGADISKPDAQGNTPLMLAAMFGKAEVVRLLLAKGAKVDTVNRMGRTPLQGAVWRGRRENVQALLEAGADPDLTHMLTTPMLLSKLRGNVEIERLLKSYGAERLIRLNYGGLTTLWRLTVFGVVILAALLVMVLAVSMARRSE